MQHGVHHAVELAGGEALEEIALVEVVLDLHAREVGHLGGVLQVVDRKDLAHALAIERLDQLRADESRGAGDDRVHG